MNELSTQNPIAAWSKTIETNNELIVMKRKLVDAGMLAMDNSGIGEMEAENEMCHVLIARSQTNIVF